MEKDYILILRNNNLYRAKVNLLSTIFSSKHEVEKLSSDVVSSLNSLSDVFTEFQDNYYTKSQIASEFCSKTTITNLTANAEYVLTSEVGNKITNLLSTSDVDKWGYKESKACVKMLIEDLNSATEVIGLKLGEHKISEYEAMPDERQLNKIIKEDGTIEEDATNWFK